MGVKLFAAREELLNRLPTNKFGIKTRLDASTSGRDTYSPPAGYERHHKIKNALLTPLFSEQERLQRAVEPDGFPPNHRSECWYGPLNST